MKKLLILCVVCVLCLGIGLVGCGTPSQPTPEQAPHTHSYSSVWSYDNEYHYKKCADNSCDSISEKTEHDIENGACKICEYVDFVTVTPDSLFTELKTSQKKYFKLSSGNYGAIYLTNKSDITLFSEDGAKITSKVTLTANNSNITLKGLNFQSGVGPTGVEILGITNGLKIENCTFTGNSQIVSKDAGNEVSNLVIENCQFIEIAGGQLSAMVVQTVTNFTVKNCNFNDVQYNAMQVGSIKLQGNVTVTGNTFKEINNRILYFVSPSEDVVWDISSNVFYECGSGKDDGNYIKVGGATITVGVNTWEVMPELDTYYFVRTITENGQTVNTIDGINIDFDEQLSLE